MSIYDDIRATFEVNLSSVVGIPDIAWENVSFNPTTASSYVQPRMVPTVREPAARGLNPQVYYQGYFLVNCYVPEGNGPSAADDLADSILNAFEATTDITNATTTLHIRYAERDLGTQEGAHFCVPVRIGWYIYS
jgi:hypothetical protein